MLPFEGSGKRRSPKRPFSFLNAESRVPQIHVPGKAAAAPLRSGMGSCLFCAQADAALRSSYNTKWPCYTRTHPSPALRTIAMEVII